jgi:cell division protease FtsH
MGGRAAEEIFLGIMTTGAANDIEVATERARKMVCEWGMSAAMGPLSFGKKEEQIFLGREIAQHQDYSEDTAVKIDQEVRHVVLDGYAKARSILEDNRDALIRLAEVLLEFEVLDGPQIDAVIKGEPMPDSLQRKESLTDTKGSLSPDSPADAGVKPAAVNPMINPEAKPAPA